MDDPMNTRPPATPTGGFDLNRPTIVGLLYLVGAFTGGLLGIVGLVLAFVWKGEAHEPWEETHYTYLIRTFWMGLLAGFIGLILIVIGIGILILIAVSIWFIVRAVMSLVKAQRHEPMPDPLTFLI